MHCFTWNMIHTTTLKGGIPCKQPFPFIYNVTRKKLPVMFCCPATLAEFRKSLPIWNRQLLFPRIGSSPFTAVCWTVFQSALLQPESAVHLLPLPWKNWCNAEQIHSFGLALAAVCSRNWFPEHWFSRTEQSEWRELRENICRLPFQPFRIFRCYSIWQPLRRLCSTPIKSAWCSVKILFMGSTIQNECRWNKNCCRTGQHGKPVVCWHRRWNPQRCL